MMLCSLLAAGRPSLARTAAAFVGPSPHSRFLVQRRTRSDCGSVVWATSPNDDNLPDPKPKSRLAQLAEDWLEEDDYDELSIYWERFSNNKESGEAILSTTIKSETANEEDLEVLTTEQRLERYFDSRGIHKGNERKYASQIEQAISKARTAITPEQAIAVLSEVQPYLQVRTRLGGAALYELAVALWQRDGSPDEDLMRELIGRNPHVKQQVQQLARRETPPKRSPSTKSFWQGFLDSNQWWN